MSALLSCRGLTKSYGGRLLFSDLTLTVGSGERIGLIGPNGSGKSTLLQVLAGLEPPDDGERAVAHGVRLSYLPQEDVFEPGLTVEQVVAQALPHLDPIERQTRARIQLGKAGFTDPEQPVDALSGGWRKRLALARLLAEEPDVALLDEPTNHLDLGAIEWLEQLLQSAPFALLVVSHDRYLLERVCEHVIEIGRHYPEGYLRVPGSYSAFLLKREEFLAAQRQRERALANTVRREVEWLRRGPRGRGTKSKDRIQQAHETMRELADVRARNAAGGTADIAFSSTGRRSRDLLVARGLAKARGGRSLFSGLDLRLGPGDRLGLLGDNGSGKSTLLAILAGELEADAGEVSRAHGLQTVVFHQDRSRLDPEATVRDTLSPEGDTVHYKGRAQHVTGWAKRFQFEPEQLATKVGALSGGERARLLIADLVRQPADLLLLDEPTNDLDLPTREVLEESLLELAGALVLVTHDRYLLEQVCTELLGFDGQGGVHPLADLDQWRRLRARVERAEKEAEKAAAQRASSKQPDAAPAPSRSPERSRKLSNKEREELERMEETIMAAEEEVAELEARSTHEDVLADHRLLEETYSALHAAQQRVEALYARWQELEALKA